MQSQSEDLINLLDDEPSTSSAQTPAHVTANDLASIFGGGNSVNSPPPNYIPNAVPSSSQTLPISLLASSNNNGNGSSLFSPPTQGGIALPNSPQHTPSLFQSSTTMSYQAPYSSQSPPHQTQRSSKDPFADLAELF